MRPTLWNRIIRSRWPIFLRSDWVKLIPATETPDWPRLTSLQVENVDKACHGRRYRSWAYIVPLLALFALVFIRPDVAVIGVFTARKIVVYSVLFATAVVYLVTRHFSTTYNILVRYAFLLRRLEQNEFDLSHMQMKRWMNYDLRRLAKLLANLPLTLGTRHPDVVLCAARKAAYVDRLQVWVAQPLDARTPELLYHTLLGSFSSFTSRRWQDLPEMEPSATAQITGWQRTGFVVLSVVFAVGAVGLAIYGKDLGTSWSAIAQIGTTVLAVGAYLCLGRAGLIPGSLQQALDTAQEVTTTGK